MAKENGISNTETTGAIDTNEPTGSTENTSTTTTTKRRGRPRTTTTATDTATAGTEKAGIPELAVVNSDTKVEEIPQPKKAKQKRTRTKKNKNDANFNADQLKAILLTVSAMAETTEATSFFALSEKEAEQIAIPLANIIANNDSLTALTEHSDSIALVTACFIIFAPKMFLFMAYQKNKKALQKRNIKIAKGVETNADRKEPATTGSSETDTRPTTDKGKNGGNSVLSSIPSLA